MISAEFFCNDHQLIEGFTIRGHAGYADYGNDIICSAVSALAINTINSIDTLVQIPVQYDQNEDGLLTCSIDQVENPDAQLLFRSLLLGLRSIQTSYGKKYLNIKMRNR
jgi:uncharacterized protein YsxB (DUF464 family)